MALFENYEGRMPQLQPVLDKCLKTMKDACPSCSPFLTSTASRALRM